MRKVSDLEKVKRIADMFLHIPAEPSKFGGLVVIHPIFESGFVPYISSSGEQKIINILESKENLYLITNEYARRINAARTVFEVYFIIRKSYRLTFLKHIKSYLSLTDFSKLLADAWVSSENPNQDANVSIKTLISWFQQADKKVLMEEEDYKVYEQLPEKITVYRGVAVGRNPSGLSWTQNLSTAKWFANRFSNDSEKGYVLKAVINKAQALAYFNRRNEDEVVANVKKKEISIISF